MEINRNNVIDIVRKCGLNPDKDYGQNFLLEPSICKEIVNALDIKESDNVLEIGPGLGSLSNYVIESGATIDLVDIDRRMIDFLKIHYGNNSNVQLICEDIRKHNVERYTKILGNLPYNITTEIITYLLFNSINAKKMVLMCQSETYNHFQDLSGSEYGPVSILIHLLGDIKKVITVKAGSFYPVPKCNSTVFSIEFKEICDRKEAIEIYKFAKATFLNRRKTISNNLKNAGYSNEIIKLALEKTYIEPNKRPEEIDYRKYRDLFINIKSIINNCK